LRAPPFGAAFLFYRDPWSLDLQKQFRNKAGQAVF
jgi:hypothetical protein